MERPANPPNLNHANQPNGQFGTDTTSITTSAQYTMEGNISPVQTHYLVRKHTASRGSAVILSQDRITLASELKRFKSKITLPGQRHGTVSEGPGFTVS
ncbi:hypothetical protein PoB_000445600 [Plakobranchus ocellatus]|uniref:Uncharacterized protein n=1 Tax=Plakobranchus ocellatus TaxID=259542 RepID=A0AAV3Y6A0_9GAST|nr:hypothetical protein PoB_000445600 [Plakobranchus ocellatus]